MTIKNESKIKTFQLEGDFNIYFMDERIHTSDGWEMTKAQAQRIFAALDKNELVSFICVCPTCKYDNTYGPSWQKRGFAINETQQYRLGDDIRIGCQRIPASVLNYAREWAKD